MKTAIQYLNSEPNTVVENYKNKLLSRIKKIDSARKENFKEIFPYMNTLVGIYA